MPPHSCCVVLMSEYFHILKVAALCAVMGTQLTEPDVQAN